MKTLEIKAGERTRIIHKFSNSLPMTYKFNAKPIVGGDEVSGLVEVQGSSWIFPKKASTQELRASNSVEKSVWDSMYSVYVTPNVDVEVSLGKSDFGKMLPLFLFALAVTGIALAILGLLGFYG